MTHSITRFGRLSAIAVTVAILGLVAPVSRGGDWPQFRGANRDAKATDFKAPKSWPKELTQKWKVTVGDGVATPALVGDKLYVFSREDGAEVTRCLKADSGDEVWKDKYDAAFRPSADRSFPGPRSSPAVADGKVVTFGVNGTLSCLSADMGKKLWRIETGAFPRFHTSSSPIIADKLVLVQIGNENRGGIAAYDLADGKEKWKWTADGSSYASPVLMTVADTKMVVVETNKSVAGVDLTDGKVKWQIEFPITGGRGYNSSSPLVDGQTIIFSGTNRGTRAFKAEKKDDGLTAKELWNNKDNSVIYNTPIIKNGLVFGQTSRDSLFCINAKTGKTAWTESVSGGRGYGTIVDAGSVLVFLSPAGNLIVFEPTDKEFKQLAKYKVGDFPYAYPILTGNRIYVKDKTSLTLWTVD